MTIPAPECISPFGQECGCGHHNGVCWPRPLTACCTALTPGPEAPPERLALIEQVMRLANEILHAFSGRQFGLCPVTYRPCRDDCARESRIVWDYTPGGGLVEPRLDGGKWFNNICGTCVTDCSCTEVCEVTLPGPVESVVSVTIDGQVLDPGEYRLDNHRKLVRQYQVAPAAGLFDWYSAGNVGFDPSYTWCNFTPLPDLVLRANGPDGGGCYPYTSNNPEWVWNNTATVTGTYNPAAGGTSGFLPATGPVESGGVPFQWPDLPAGTVLTPGTPYRSAAIDGIQYQITVQSGTVTKSAGNGFTVEPGAVVTMTRLARSPACWPTCQDMNKPLGEDGTFGVTVLKGTPVPEFGRWAAGLLACQLIKVCGLEDESCCTLPANVQAITREGVSMDLSPLGITADGTTEFGRTGIPEVDLWLAAVNPHKSTSRSRVYSVDRPRPRRTTWPCDE